jgi:uncharacterized protein (DUF2252 family)
MGSCTHMVNTVRIPSPRRSLTERAEQGKAARARAPRSSHAQAVMPADRADPVSLLERQGETRVPDLVPVRYGRMLVSPFTFFRGAALLMASDLARTPVSGLMVQACGDAHLSNFGIFGSAERRLMFDINDFDETLPGPWEWDVKRLAASLEVAGRENGLTRKQRRAVVLAMAGRYREAMRGFAGLSNLRVFYARVDVEQIRAELGSRLTARQRKLWDQGQARARTADSMRDLKKLTRMVGGQRRIVADPPLIVPLGDMLADLDPAEIHTQIGGLVTRYRRTLQPDRRLLLDQYELTDVAHKVVGVGSVGTRCWIVLMLGQDHHDPLFLQVKEAQQSVLAPFAGASKIANEGQRVVTGQRVMQAAGDAFLGWNSTKSGPDSQARHFYVRQLRDWKYSVDIATLAPDGLRLYGELCGWTLARAHARSGDRVAIAAYLGSSDVFDQAIAEFASGYADQNERDHRALAEAAASGRITANRDV